MVIGPFSYTWRLHDRWSEVCREEKSFSRNWFAMPVHLHSQCLPDMRGKMGTPTFGFSLFLSHFSFPIQTTRRPLRIETWLGRDPAQQDHVWTTSRCSYFGLSGLSFSTSWFRPKSFTEQCRRTNRMYKQKNPWVDQDPTGLPCPYPTNGPRKRADMVQRQCTSNLTRQRCGWLEEKDASNEIGWSQQEGVLANNLMRFWVRGC